MKGIKIKLTIALITIVAALGATTIYTKVIKRGEKDINVIAYREPGEIDKNSYQISKYEDLQAKQWLDENRVIVLKKQGWFVDEKCTVSAAYLSIYDLNTKTYKDYDNINMNLDEIDGISPSGKYVLYCEPRNIPTVGSKEWEEVANSGEIFNAKRNILDITTGEIIRNIDKTINNCNAQYRWINDDYIFVDYGAYWSILDKNGNLLKEGKIEFNEPDKLESDYTWLIDASDIKVEGNDFVGSFYYVKNYREADNTIADALYCMDINTNGEKLIGKYDDSSESRKQGNIIAIDTYNNNGESQNGVYENRTFGFKIIDKNGKEIRNYEFEKDRNYDFLELSANGDKCVFVEGDGWTAKDYNILNSSIKVMDINSGEVKEIASYSSLLSDVNNGEIKRENYNGVSNVVWDSTGTSLMFDFGYTSKDDGSIHTSTYIVTFDK